MVEQGFVVGLLESLGEESEEVDEGTGMAEEEMVWQLADGDLVGLPTDLFFEFLDVKVREGKEFLDKKEMEEFLLDFGVHKYFV